MVDWIAPGSRVLDLGCGDGAFLETLRDERAVEGVGLEIDEAQITRALGRGLSIVQQDMDRGLSNFPDQSFDTVVLAHAIQAIHYPDEVLEEMLRIGRRCIVTFPNFGQWRCRLYLLTRGRMPVSRFLPYNWYDTPNIHFCTVRDFEQLCRERRIRVSRRRMIGADGAGWLARLWPNLFAVTAVYLIERED